ncbi:hypothetical protein F5887DRAFT_962794 [Amanita rubescens]|nr:hypothetical protein F5887DRAFT_962794 [Amanita rubescens]
MLADLSSASLEPPSAPFAVSPTTRSIGGSPTSLSHEMSSGSLSLNYLPKKFSSRMLNAGNPRRRKNAKKGDQGFDPKFPKRGGGIEAFRSGEARMPSEGDDDSDPWLAGKKRGKKMKWNKFKWILFCTNLLFTIYTLIGLIILLLTWFNIFTHADVVRTGNRAELVLSTLAAVVGLFTSMVGWAGILLNNRSFLAIYTFLTWVTFGLLVIPGYITYKKHTFNLPGKINAQWSQALSTSDRLIIQNELQCCGYYDPFEEATVSATCYSRTVLPGCKGPYLDFERVALVKFYTVVFSLVPLQIAIMVSGLLCSNHVTYSLNTMALIMDQYASQLAEQYGRDVASDILARSRANLSQLDSMPTMPYHGSAASTTTPVYHAKYDSIGSRTPETVS